MKNPLISDDARSPLRRLQTLPWLAKALLQIAALVVGLVAGAFIVFQVFFLAKVIPHGGF